MMKKRLFLVIAVMSLQNVEIFAEVDEVYETVGVGKEKLGNQKTIPKPNEFTHSDPKVDDDRQPNRTDQDNIGGKTSESSVRISVKDSLTGNQSAGKNNDSWLVKFKRTSFGRWFRNDEDIVRDTLKSIDNKNPDKNIQKDREKVKNMPREKLLQVFRGIVFTESPGAKNETINNEMQAKKDQFQKILQPYEILLIEQSSGGRLPPVYCIADMQKTGITNADGRFTKNEIGANDSANTIASKLIDTVNDLFSKGMIGYTKSQDTVAQQQIKQQIMIGVIAKHGLNIDSSLSRELYKKRFTVKANTR